MFPLSIVWGSAQPILNLSGNKRECPALLVEVSNATVYITGKCRLLVEDNL